MSSSSGVQSQVLALDPLPGAGRGTLMAGEHSNRRMVALAVGLFAALSTWAGVASKGFLEADACTHYLYSRFCLDERHLLTNVWGRPFCTAIYAPAAYLFERTGVRVFSMLLAVGIGLITCRIAKNQGYRWPGLALVFLLAQPLVFLHSFSELTELPFALLMALAFWAYQGRAWGAMALLVGLMPTARPEGFGFIVLAAAALMGHRKWHLLPVLALPLAVWSVTGWVQFGMAQPWWREIALWLPKNWPYADKSLYRPGSVVHFLLQLPVIVSPLILPAMLLGVWRSMAADGAMRIVRGVDAGRRYAGLIISRWDHATRCQWLIALLPLMVLAGHSVLYWAGRMASNGELRYMLVVAPFWALLAAKGWEWGFQRLRLKHPMRWALAAAFVPFGVNWIYRVVPIQMTQDWVRAQEVAEFHRTRPWGTEYPKLMATHSGLYYFLDLSPTDWSRCVEWGLKTASAPPDGVVAIWDPMYGRYNADANRSISLEDLKRYGWVPVKVFPRVVKRQEGNSPVSQLAEAIQSDVVGEWVVLLSPRDAQGKHTPREWEVEIPVRGAGE